MSQRLPFLILITLALLTTAAESRASQTMPATRPALPNLTTSPNPDAATPFLAVGTFAEPDGRGLAFRVAFDGTRQTVAFWATTDGTPLLFSDGRETLVYDLARDRVARVPESRGYVSIILTPADPTLPTLDVGVQYRSNSDRLVEVASAFEFGRIADLYASLFVREASPGPAVVYVADPPGEIEPVRFLLNPDRPEHFRFAWGEGGVGQGGLNVEVTLGRDGVPESALAFPDVTRLGESVRVDDLAGSPTGMILAFVQGGRGWLAKLAVLAGPDGRAGREAMFGDADWPALERRDAELGAKYRAALAEQGFIFPTTPPPATTRPAP